LLDLDLYLTKKISYVQKSSAYLKLYHMSGYAGLRGGTNSWRETGAVEFHHRTGVKEDHKLALQDTTQVRDFAFESPHMLIVHCIILYNTLYISHLCR
jgi:hypothetical protein